MQLILSAPSPSEAAKFIGQILSIITSIILDKLPPGSVFYSFKPFLFGLLVGEDGFLDMPGEEPLAAFIVDLLCLVGDELPLLILFFYSYTKFTAS